jgi:hypothetical protein
VCISTFEQEAAERRRKAQEERRKSKAEEREKARQEKARASAAVIDPGEVVAPKPERPKSPDPNQVLQRVKLEKKILNQMKEEAKKPASAPTAKWKFDYDGQTDEEKGKEAPDADEAYRGALEMMWREIHGGEALVYQDGHIRTFPAESSWFEILAVLRESMRDLGRKLKMEHDIEELQKMESDMGSEEGWAPPDDHKTDEEKELELVYKEFVELQNNGARWLGQNDRLTRLKLLGGTRKLLRLDMSWEQFDNLYRYLNPGGHGKKSYLTREEFVEAFSHPPVGAGRAAGGKVKRGFIAHNGAAAKAGSEMGGEGRGRGVELLRKVMDSVCATLVQHGLTLREVIWCFDRNGDETVSVSEFASLMKMLVGRAFTRHEIYLVMDSMDTSLDRRLQASEMMEFFFIFWSDQLRRAKAALDQSPRDAALQKAVHSFRHLITSNFDREFRDGMKGRSELVGPFAPLLRKMGVVAHEELHHLEAMDLEGHDDDDAGAKTDAAKKPAEAQAGNSPKRPKKVRKGVRDRVISLVVSCGRC